MSRALVFDTVVRMKRRDCAARYALLKRRSVLGLLSVLLGSVWAFAQPDATTPPLPEPSPAQPAAQPGAIPSLLPPAQTPSHTQPAVKSAADELDKLLFGQEIWRLPPVSGNGGGSGTASESGGAPAALAMPPAETFPAAPALASPPASNAPFSLSGKLSNSLSDNQPLEVKPPGPNPDKVWDGSLDLGVDGSQGNSDTFNLHLGFHAKRKTEDNILSLSLDYNKRSAQTVTTADRLFFEGRWEWLVADTPRSWFVHETVEYDQFQPFDVRDTSDAGMGYRLIKNDQTTFIGRLGAGFSHEYGGPENGLYVPEIVFGVQLEHQISKRQKLLGLVEYAPDVGDFPRYRIRTQAALEVMLDDEKNLSLRMGVLEIYNSVPNGALRNDLDYALMLMWKF